MFRRACGLRKASRLCLTLPCKCQAKGERAKNKQQPGAGDFGFCEKMGAYFYPGELNSFAQAKRGTFAPPFLSQAWERKRRAAV